MNKKLTKAFELKAKKIELAKKNPKYQKVIDTLVHYGFLTNGTAITTAERQRVPAHKLDFKDADYAGEIEPRIFEVLPAIILRRPKIFSHLAQMPEDLKKVVRGYQAGRAIPAFRGMDPKKIEFWIQKFKKKNSADRSIQRLFRFSREDVSKITNIRRRLNLKSDSEAIRRALGITEEKLYAEKI